MIYDVVIVGGGPAGLSAALAMGRSRRRTLLCDAGPRRNAAAVHVHNFVTRDGTPPDAFRHVARAQLAEYPHVEIRDERVEDVSGARGAFHVRVAGQVVETRRVLIVAGLVDEMLPIEGYRELWGHAIFQCPYCHGWEVRDQAWGYLVREPDAAHLLPFALKLRGWTERLVVLTGGTLAVPDETRARLAAAGVGLETEVITRLVARDGHSVLEGVALASGKVVPISVLFSRPPQRQVALVAALGLALDDDGFVRVDPMTKETSLPGVYAAGDLTTRMQGAIFAAAAGTQAAAMIDNELAMELGA